MNLIVGLGNPGKQYINTRHNVGFMLLDKISSDFKFNKKYNSEISKNGDVKNLLNKFDLDAEDKTVILKPQTFMNLSGVPVQQIMSYYKVSNDNLIVIHDDLDILLGEFKIQKNRSSAGHKGVQSIIENLGTKDFYRIRIGIKSTNNLNKKVDIEKFVLQKFTSEELKKIDEVIKTILQ